MSNHPDCFYCEQDQRQKDLMIEVVTLTVSKVFVFKEQTYHGRCVVAYNQHVNELYELSDSERNAFMADVARVARVMSLVFKPTKINYGVYSDKLPHLHFHLVPKYRDGPDFGSPFRMIPEPKVILDDSAYQAMVDSLKAHLA